MPEWNVTNQFSFDCLAELRAREDDDEILREISSTVEDKDRQGVRFESSGEY